MIETLNTYVEFTWLVWCALASTGFWAMATFVVGKALAEWRRGRR